MNRFVPILALAVSALPAALYGDEKNFAATEFKMNKEKQSLDIVSEKGDSISLSLKDGVTVTDAKGNSFKLEKYSGIITWPPGKKGPGKVKVSISGNTVKIVDDSLVLESFRPKKDGEATYLRIRAADFKD